MNEIKKNIEAEAVKDLTRIAHEALNTRAEDSRIAALESDLEYLNRWKTLIERAPEFEAQKIAVERFLKTDGMRPFLESFKTRIAELETENTRLKMEREEYYDRLQELRAENARLSGEIERHKNREANDKKAMDIIERASEYFGENPDFAVEFSNVKKENERLSAEVEKWKRLASGKAI